jgi:hypothetical protein
VNHHNKDSFAEVMRKQTPIARLRADTLYPLTSLRPFSLQYSVTVVIPVRPFDSISLNGPALNLTRRLSFDMFGRPFTVTGCYRALCDMKSSKDNPLTPII